MHAAAISRSFFSLCLSQYKYYTKKNISEKQHETLLEVFLNAWNTFGGLHTKIRIPETMF